MHRVPSLRSHVLLGSVAAACLALSVLGVSPVSSPGEPVSAGPQDFAGPVARSVVASGSAGPVAVSLETTSPSILPPAGFVFDARAVLPEDVESLTLRFQIRRPTGRLIFQRTRIVNDPGEGTVVESFARNTDDLALRPGRYPVTLSVTAREGDTVHASVLEGALFVYDESAAPVPLVVFARVSGQPLSEPGGRFAEDPAVTTRARDEVRALCDWVSAEPRARLTLSVSPVLLEEWARIAAGYELIGPEGVTAVATDTPAPREYAAALQSLKEAIATGRLELTALGYADPDLVALDAAGATEDAFAQYERGRSALFAALETEPSTGSVPASGCVPAGATRALEAAGVEYMIVTRGCLRGKRVDPAVTSYRVGADGPVVLVSSEATAPAVDVAFGRLLDAAAGPLVVGFELEPGGPRASQLIEQAERLAAHPWVEPVLGRESAPPPAKRTITLAESDVDPSDPDGYWEDVAEARLWADALIASLGEQSVEAAAARDASMIAASAAWAAPDDTWLLADRGRSFADAALRVSESYLQDVTITAPSITLSGASGNVFATVTNGSDTPLSVKMVYSASGGARIEGEESVDVLLEPMDNFLEIPVDLGNALSGSVTVRVMAADLELATSTVDVSASYLDRIAIVAAVILLLAGILVYVIRRVRAEEEREDAAVHATAYTGQKPDTAPLIEAECKAPEKGAS